MLNEQKRTISQDGGVSQNATYSPATVINNQQDVLDGMYQTHYLRLNRLSGEVFLLTKSIVPSARGPNDNAYENTIYKGYCKLAQPKF